MEKRRVQRFEVNWPLVFGWLDESGTTRWEAGFTRNISTDGMLVLCGEVCPPCYTRVTISVLLLSGMGRQPWRMRSTGHVLRVRSSSQIKEFATTLDHLEVEVLENGPQ